MDLKALPSQSMIPCNEAVSSPRFNCSKTKDKTIPPLPFTQYTTVVVTTALITAGLAFLPSVQDRNHLLNFHTVRQNYQFTFTTSDMQIKIKLQSKYKLKQNQALTFEGC